MEKKIPSKRFIPLSFPLLGVSVTQEEMLRTILNSTPSGQVQTLNEDRDVRLSSCFSDCGQRVSMFSQQELFPHSPVPPAGTHVFKHMSSLRTLQIQAHNRLIDYLHLN